MSIISGSTGISARSASARAMAAFRPAGDRSSVVIVPERPSCREVIASVRSSAAPEVVTSLRAKRVWETRRAASATSHSPLEAQASAASSVAFTLSRVQSVRSPAITLLRPDDVDAAEAAGGAAVAHGVDLGRLPLAVAVQPDVGPGRLVADGVARLPEVGRAALVRDVGDLRADLALLDLPEGVAAELEVVALVVDRVRPPAFDQDAVVHPRHEVVERHRLLARLEPHVRHALERDRGVRVGIGAAGRLLLPDPARLLARRLVADEDPLLEQVPALRLHSVVVVAAGRQRARQDPVAVDVDDLRADPEAPQLVRRQERGAGEVGLVAQRPIELGRVADRLVDGEPQVGGQEHQVLLPGRDGGRLQVGDRFLADAPGVVEEARPLDELVAAADRVRAVGAALGLARLEVARRGGELGRDLHDALPDAAAFGRSEEALL